ncbi:MAG: septum site-determining protein MinC [Heliobacteriaceae bacterium]|nr:septum site-determining protein MinC [Heliobacteriaceae bacterium]MDD4586917.1 septum site-determining protein MinC [Heliobacteriaceae bacterium]
MKKADIVIKGSKDGLVLYLDSQCDFLTLVAAIEEKLGAADCFLVGANVLVDVGHRQLTPVEKGRLETLLPSYGLILRGITGEPPDISGTEEEVVVKGNRERIYQIANHLYETGEDVDVVGEWQLPANQGESSARPSPGSETAGTLGQEASVITQGGDEQTLLIQRTLRSGQAVRYPGNVVILGDVNPGAEVVAGGNIIVMGCFRGVAHAGALGRQDSVIVAFRLRPTQLRIANHITRPPDDDDPMPDHPEIARIRDGVVTIERYLFGNKSN